MSSELPTRPRTFRLSDQDYDHLSRLQELLGRRSQTDVMSIALTHLLSSLQRDERVHLTVSDQEDEQA